MKQLAWLHTAPREKKSLQKNAPTKQMSRLQTITEAGTTPALPDAGAAGHLSAYLFECGPVAYGAMGAIPLSWHDIHAWQQAVGIDLAAWEARALRRLSADYLHQSQLAEEPDCPAPYIDRDSERRAAVASKVRAIFGGRAA